MEAIVAVYDDWGIGKDGTQPVTVSADRKRFRQLTEGSAVIVGRKTLADFPGGKPLPKRHNIVLTRQDIDIPGAEVVHSVEEAVEAARRHERCLVIGGESVYRAMWEHIDRVHVTHVFAAPESDSYFPNVDEDKRWRQIEADEPISEGDLSCQFLVYEKESTH